MFEKRFKKFLKRLWANWIIYIKIIRCLFFFLLQIAFIFQVLRFVSRLNLSKREVRKNLMCVQPCLLTIICLLNFARETRRRKMLEEKSLHRAKKFRKHTNLQRFKTEKKLHNIWIAFKTFFINFTSSLFTVIQFEYLSKIVHIFLQQSYSTHKNRRSRQNTYYLLCSLSFRNDDVIPSKPHHLIWVVLNFHLNIFHLIQFFSKLLNANELYVLNIKFLLPKNEVIVYLW